MNEVNQNNQTEVTKETVDKLIADWQLDQTRILARNFNIKLPEITAKLLTRFFKSNIDGLSQTYGKINKSRTQEKGKLGV